MPALDPYAAVSRPITHWDSQPKQPLPFAQTLFPRDPNQPTPSPEQSQRPFSSKKEREKLPERLPQPPYGHAKHASFDLSGLNMVVDQDAANILGSDEWMQARVAQCLDSASRDLDLSNKGLTQLSTKVEDLANLVTLLPAPSPSLSATHSPFTRSPSQISASGSPNPAEVLPNFEPKAGPLAANSRSFSRTVSAPVSQFSRASFAPPVFPRIVEDGAAKGLGLMPPAPIDPPGRSFRRSKTGAAPLQSSSNRHDTRREITLNIAGNLLTTLPSVLFELSNLTYLSLRSNKLTELPAAIGELQNLKELNVGMNFLTFLPYTILNLPLLERLFLHPNEFHKQPKPLPSTTSTTTNIQSRHMHASERKLGPLISHLDQSVPRLTTILINFLISPRPPTNHPPLLDFDWTGAEERGGTHPLLDASALHRRIPCIPEHRLKRMLQAVRSGSRSAKDKTAYLPQHKGLSGSQGHPRPDPFPESHKPLRPDDASQNPYYSPCPSPRHRVFDGHITPRPTRHLFLDPAEERIEWKEVKGEKDIPIRWQGCSPGCLAFLEVKEEDEDDDFWGVEDEDQEAT